MTMENIEKKLQNIADAMSSNYVTVSFSGRLTQSEQVAGVDNETDIINKVFTDAFVENNKESITHGGQLQLLRHRNILIVGSGATFGTYPSIPLGQKTKETLLKELNILDSESPKKQNERFNKYIESKLFEEAKRLYMARVGEMPSEDTLRKLIMSDKFDFETFLFFLTKFIPEQKVREKIEELFNVRHAPSYTYELIAHLFKHGFIDIIINFNFDEILDQAIEEEMGLGNYHYIISDGQCKGLEEIMVDGRLKIPVYIKPHGTVSHKSTLRFTKDHYFDLPEDIYELIEKLIKGQIAPNDNENKIAHVNIIGVGFDFASLELNHILKTSLSDKSQIYAFTYKICPNIVELKEEKGPSYGQNWIDLSIIEKEIKQQPLLDFVFESIVSKIDSNFKDNYKPRGIFRHKLIKEIFYSNEKDPKKDFNNKEYFKDRVILELAIALAKGKGIIESKEMMNDRLGMMYELYRKEFEKEKKEEKEEIKSLYDLIEIFDLKEDLSFSRNLHNYEIAVKEQEGYKNFKKLLGWNSKSEPEFGISIIYKILTRNEKIGNISYSDIEKLDIKDKTLEIIKLLNSIYNTGSYLHINPRFYDRRLFVFEHFYKDQILHTNLSFTYRINEVLEKPEAWDMVVPEI